MFESNKLIKKDFNIKRDSTPPEQKEIFNELLEERSSEFRILEKIVLIIYKYKTKWESPKDFRNYENLIELFKNLRDSNVNPREKSKIIKKSK